ncbi:MAG: sirohydrochlorin cobaltochelatase [Deltaproteobacteria bacterium]|jgi:sirohydrochlorin cobaltochelatase|nr:sirohydrochlorin cobaltochelatase [Deltaproteobacteria bacterium]MBT4526237.1 sirohydrochlorin cobaltochelatase [Deltaproteobacteria bacterium]
MFSKKIVSTLIFTMILLFSSVVFASGHGSDQAKKVGILLVAFGSSEASAQVSFDNIDMKVKKAFPNIPVRWSYTSHIIRKKLAKSGKYLDSPEVALAKMADEKFTHVAIQSLHTIRGAEFEDLSNTIAGFKLMGVFQEIQVGQPLLASQEDIEKTVNAILGSIPAEREASEAVVLMGHGTHHPANAFYSALAYQLQLRDANIMVGTVEGYPELDTVQKQLVKNNIKTTYLMPFMSVAGDHAKNDMAGDEDDSWKSILSKAGYECKPVLKGTAEYDSFAKIWVSHLGETLSHFEH